MTPKLVVAWGVVSMVAFVLLVGAAADDSGSRSGVGARDLPVAVVGGTHAFLWRNGRFADLGTLGGKDSEAVAINSSGQVVGWSDTRTGRHAFRWQSGKLTDLGTLAGSRNRVSFAYAVNGRGQIVGATRGGRSHFTARGRAFLWQQGKLSDLGTLGGAWSLVTDINDAGQVVGWSARQGSDAPMRSFLWRRGRMTDLGTLGGRESAAMAINERGTVVGYSAVTPRPNDPWQLNHAFLWENGRMLDLGTLGGRESSAGAINERGQVVGSSYVTVGSPGLRHAFLWQDGKMRDLGTLGGKESYAWALNERGHVVGRAQTSSGAWHAYLWQGGRMRDLGALGGRESDARAINERGQVVGTYMTAKGITRAFVWTGGEMRDLGSLGGQSVTPGAINDRGQIVGTSETLMPAEPPPAALQEIAYVGLDPADDDLEIGPQYAVFTIRADASHRWPLIGNAATPSWSPDGRRIAYTSDGQLVAVANADGTKARTLRVGPSFCYAPTWAPNGRQIACVAGWYERSGKVFRSALYAVDVKTGRTHVLLRKVAADATPSWSPNGRRIAYDDGGLKVLDLKTNRTTRLGNGTDPDWSPNGETIAYSTGHAIAEMKANGTGRRTIVSSRDFVADPSWAPDGSRLVYAQARAGGASSLYIVAADGAKLHLLVRGGFAPDWRRALSAAR